MRGIGLIWIVIRQNYSRFNQWACSKCEQDWAQDARLRGPRGCKE